MRLAHPYFVLFPDTPQFSYISLEVATFPLQIATSNWLSAACLIRWSRMLYKFRSTETECGQLKEHVGIAQLHDSFPSQYLSGIALPDYTADEWQLCIACFIGGAFLSPIQPGSAWKAGSGFSADHLYTYCSLLIQRSRCPLRDLFFQRILGRTQDHEPSHTVDLKAKKVKILICQLEGHRGTDIQVIYYTYLAASRSPI